MKEKIKVIAYIEPAKIGVLKFVLKKLSKEASNVKIGSPKIGEMSDKIVVYFKTEKKNAEFVARTLKNNDIKVLPNSDLSEYVNQNNDSEKQFLRSTIIHDQINKRSNFVPNMGKLQSYVDTGNYKEYLKMFKNKLYLPNDQKEILDNNFLNVFRNYFNYIDEKKIKKSNIEYILDDLLEIACLNFPDPRINFAKKTASSKYLNMVKENSTLKLVDFMTVRNIPDEFFIKAIILFFENVFENPDSLNEEVKYFYKNVSQRMIGSKLDAIGHTLSDDEMDKVSRVLETFNGNLINKTHSKNVVGTA